jgi:nicotinamide-nucleotide adenylyltransferase
MKEIEFKFHRDSEGYDIGLEAKPKGKMNVDLEKLSDRFDRLHLKSSVVLVTEMEGARVSIYPDGRIILFDVDEEEGREIASKVFDIMTGKPRKEEEGKALFVGRFQPFHLGHLKAIKEILEVNKEITIVIGSAQEGRTPENPFTLEERKQMIEKSLKEANIKNYKIISVKDFNNDEKWAGSIKDMAKFDVVYTMNLWTERCFEKIGVPVKRHRLYENDRYSGTEIRNRIMEDKNWKNLVPRPVAKLIRSVKGEERIKKLNKITF